MKCPYNRFKEVTITNGSCIGNFEFHKPCRQDCKFLNWKDRELLIIYNERKQY